MSKYIAAAVAILSLGLAACGETGGTSTAAKPDKPAAQTSHKPTTVLGCLKDGKDDAKLSDVESRGGGVWIGYTDAGDLIRVKRMDSPTEAKVAVKAATDVQGAAAKRYVVFGPLGSGLTVKPIARCLRTI